MLNVFRFYDGDCESVLITLIAANTIEEANKLYMRGESEDDYVSRLMKKYHPNCDEKDKKPCEDRFRSAYRSKLSVCEYAIKYPFEVDGEPRILIEETL